jgi:putative DNA primase/helicase
MKQKPVTIELAEAALDFIPANLPRDDWARIGAAIKSEFPTAAGFDSVRHLEPDPAKAMTPRRRRRPGKASRPAAERPSARLFFEAKARGFDLAAWHKEHDEKEPKQTPEQHREADERRTREQAAARQREQARTEAAHARAAAEAAALWAQASDAGRKRLPDPQGCAGVCTALHG